MSKKPLEIDCVAGSQLRDTQGEMLSVEGCDISALENGTAKWTDNHGKGFFNNIGRITYGKKIFKSEDCEDDRQRYYWEKIKAPFIYAKGYLYNDEDHPNAKAAAAVVRNIHRSDCPLKMKASVEGGVIARGIKDPTLLARTKLNGVALTLTPANNATLVEPLNLDKTNSNWEADMTLIKSVMHLAQTNVPSFRHITRAASAEKIEQNINKIMTAMGSEAPANLKEELIKASLERKIAENIVTINKLVKSAVHPKALWDQAAGASTSIDHPSHQVLKDYWLEQGHPVDSKGQLQSQKMPKGIDHIKNWNNLHENARPILWKIDPAQSHQRAMDSINYLAKDYIPSLLEAHPSLQHHAESLRKLPSVNSMREANGIYDHLQNASEAVRSMLGPEPETNSQIHASNKTTNNPIWGVIAPHVETRHGIWAPLWNLVWNSHAVNHTYGKDSSDSKFTNDFHDMLWQWADSGLKKALTAGYGGAGAPTSLTGGGVLQSESQEIGPKGLSFITCDDCGDEQVYGKFQVKCRKCNKAFSMNKLEKFFQARRK